MGRASSHPSVAIRAWLLPATRVGRHAGTVGKAIGGILARRLTDSVTAAIRRKHVRARPGVLEADHIPVGPCVPHLTPPLALRVHPLCSRGDEDRRQYEDRDAAHRGARERRR